MRISSLNRRLKVLYSLILNLFTFIYKLPHGGRDDTGIHIMECGVDLLHLLMMVIPGNGLGGLHRLDALLGILVEIHVHTPLR